MTWQLIKRDGQGSDVGGIAVYIASNRYGVLDAIDLAATFPLTSSTAGANPLPFHFVYDDTASDANVLKAYDFGVKSMLQDRLRVGKAATEWDGAGTKPRVTAAGIRPDRIEPVWSGFDLATPTGTPASPACGWMLYDPFRMPFELMQSAHHTRIALSRLIQAPAP